MEDTKHKFYLTSSIKIEQETPALRELASSVIKLPSDPEKQPDLGYLSAVLVSTGTNLNGAHFMGSELVQSADTVTNKALDLEHVESEILGFISSSAFTTKDHEPLDLQELAKLETASLDTKDMHIHIGCVMFKARFPEIYKDIKANKYAVSMECYYKNYDIKVGDVIIPKEAAMAAGIDITDDSLYGKSAKIVKDGKEIAAGKLVRVLRGICFSGVGIVENPANPASVILEAASVNTTDTLIIDMSEAASNNVTSKDIEPSVITANTGVTESVTSVTPENGESAGSDQAVLISSIELTATKHVEGLIKNRQSFDEANSKLNRLRNALERASKII